MSDGTTAIHVSPVSEDEMSQIKSLFTRAADIIVAFSSLSSQVQQMQTELNELRQNTQRYRNQIDTQDEVLYRLRREREESLQEYAKAKQEAQDAKHDLTKVEDQLTATRADYDNTMQRLDDYRKERDEAQYKVEELKEKVQSLEDTLARFRDLARALEPVPTPKDLGEPTQVITPFPSWPPKTEVTEVHSEEHPQEDQQAVKSGW